MPGELTQYGANIALDHLTGRSNAYTTATRTTYLALYSAAPSDTAAGTEISAAGYARQSTTWSAPAGDPSSTNNTATITFGPFTADPPSAGWCALCDASTAGNRVMWWTLDAAKDAAINESIEFAAAALVMTLD